MEYLSGDISHLSRNDQVANIQAGGKKLQSMFESYKANQEPKVGDVFNIGSTNVDVAGPLDLPSEYQFTEKDERETRADVMKRFQTQIDATDSVYDTILADKRLEGEGRLGSQRAISARSGLLGSDFGAAQKDRVTGFNSQITDSVQAERSLAIAAILGEARTAASEEVAAKRTAREQGAQEYLTFIKEASTRKDARFNQVISDLLAQGVDPNQLTPEQLSEIQKNLGKDQNDVMAAFNRQKVDFDAQQAAGQAEAASAALDADKTRAEIAKLEAQASSENLITVGDGQMVYNPETGEFFENPKSFAPRSGGSSSGSNFSSGDEQILLGGGWTEGELSLLDQDVRSFGLPAVLENAEASGASQAQITALQKAYGVDAEENTQFLDAAYFNSIFTEDQLNAAAIKAGFRSDSKLWPGKKGDTSSYVSHLVKSVEAMRRSGQSDQEILKQFQ